MPIHRSVTVIGVFLCSSFLVAISVLDAATTAVELTGSHLELDSSGAFPFSTQHSSSWFNGARFSVGIGTTDLFLAVEEMPEAQRWFPVSFLLGGPGGSVIPVTMDMQEVFKLRACDLGLRREYRLGTKWTIAPWLGASQLKIEHTSMVPAATMLGILPPADTNASERLWGLTAGLQAQTALGRSLQGTLRINYRWAEGTISRVETGFVPGNVVPFTSRRSVRGSREMLGADAGLRWAVSSDLQIEGGWLYRDWQEAAGPASFSGPYARLVLVF
jgi:hypothetical protein